MLRESSRQQAISLDSDFDVELASPAVRKVDFSKTSRKKVQTPKKKAAFTPLRRVLDIKPKFEPESPTAPNQSYKGSGGQTREYDLAGARAIKEPEDVKPDIDNLDELLGGLTIEKSRTPDSSQRQPIVKAELEPWTPATRKPVASSSTPLFLPYDTPATPAPRQTASLRDETVAVAPAPSALDLFSDDSPPVKRETWSPVPSPSRSSVRSRSISPGVTEQTDRSVASSPSPSPERRTVSDIPALSNSVAGPSRTKTPAKRRAFLDFLAQVDGDETEEEEGLYDHDLSGSMGSLRDFIAEDDEVDYQSGLSDHELDSDIESCDSKDIGATRVPKFELDSDGEICELTHYPKGELCGSQSDSDVELVEEEAISRPKAGVSAKPTLLAEFIDSEDDDLLEASEVDDDLSSSVDRLHIESKVPSSSRMKGKKPTKAPKWALERVRIAQEVFDDLDKRVFEGRLGENGAGAKIVWNKRLLTTAGTAHRKKRRHPDGTTTFEVGIQLSDKVCTGEEQILSTVAHEMCHLACWVIDNEFKNPHGKVFKSWGRKVMRKRDDLEVTTRHDYVIEYKYKWRCVGCQKVYKRHSKSIDISKQGCGICKGKLEPMFETKQRASNTFQIYLKENMATAKASLPGASHGDVMRALSARWAEAGPEADHQSHWKAVLAASRS